MSILHIMEIRGKKVVLRAIEVGDLEQLNVWANDPDIQHGLGGWHFPTSMNDQHKWFDQLSVHSLNQRFAIHTEQQGLIGTTNLMEIDWKNRHAHHGLMLGNKDTRGKGLGLDVVMAVMRYAFEDLGFNRLDGSIIEHNTASMKLYLGKCGWKEEGRQRNWYYRQGRFWDRIIVGVTQDDYADLCALVNYWKD
ncbi:MAG: GNAT family N-acetyltransferase [Flavobacteriales bacterium]|nr:GNAT family N-acetyltransferase [Flavobacteriales bacterium]